jgi:hypothetical protein
MKVSDDYRGHMSLLLLLAALLALLLLGKVLANFLVPFPFALDVSCSVFHVHFLLALALKLVKTIFLLTVSLGLLIDLSLDVLRNLFDGVLLTGLALIDLFSLTSDVFNLNIFKLILIISLLRQDVSLLLKELSYPIAHEVLSLNLLIEKLYPLVELQFFLVENATLATKLALSFPLSVLNVKLFLSLSLIDLLLKVEDLLIVLVSFLSELVLGFLEVFVQTFNLLIKILLFVSQSIELALSIETSLDVGFKL